MKRVLFLLLAMTLALSTCLGLVSCERTDHSGDKKPDAGNSDMGDGGASRPFLVDLAGYGDYMATVRFRLIPHVW